MPSKNGPTLRNYSSTPPGESYSAGTAAARILMKAVIQYLLNVDEELLLLTGAEKKILATNEMRLFDKESGI